MTDNDKEDYIKKELSAKDSSREELSPKELFQAIEDSIIDKATQRIKKFEEKTVTLFWGVVIAIGISMFGLIFDNWRISDEKIKAEVLSEMYKIQLETSFDEITDFKSLLEETCITPLPREPENQGPQN